LLDGALDALLADGDVETGLAERVRQRAEGVPGERLRRQRALALVEVARRRWMAQLFAQALQELQQLLAGRKPTWDEPRLPLRGVPAAEVLDHRLRMDGRLRIGRELPHRRRAAEPLGALLQLGEDLLVGVALAQACLELGQSGRVDLP